MIYYINQMVKFDTETKLLINKEHEHSLTNASVRLLETLINNNGIIVSKDDLIEFVWENQGYVPSGNSLTNTISLLRKAFLSFGLNNVIETIPKKGFRLNVEVTTFSETENISETLQYPRPEVYGSEHKLGSSPCEDKSKDIPANEENTEKPFKQSSNPLFKKIILTITALFVVCVIIVFLFTEQAVISYKTSQCKNTYIKKYKKCDIYRPNNVSEKDAITFLEEPYALSKLNSLCESEGLVFYDQYSLRVEESPVESFMSYCSLNKKGSENDCENFINIETR